MSVTPRLPIKVFIGISSYQTIIKTPNLSSNVEKYTMPPDMTGNIIPSYKKKCCMWYVVNVPMHRINFTEALMFKALPWNPKIITTSTWFSKHGLSCSATALSTNKTRAHAHTHTRKHTHTHTHTHTTPTHVNPNTCIAVLLDDVDYRQCRQSQLMSAMMWCHMIHACLYPPAPKDDNIFCKIWISDRWPSGYWYFLILSLASIQ